MNVLIVSTIARANEKRKLFKANFEHWRRAVEMNRVLNLMLL